MKTRLLIYVGITLFFLNLSCKKEIETTLLPLELVSPDLGEKEQTLNTILEWKNPNVVDYDYFSYKYDIFLGKSENSLELIDTNGTVYSYTENPKFECHALDMATDYYWKVRAKKGNEIIESEIFKFTTTGHLPSYEFNGTTKMIYPFEYIYEYPDSLIQYMPGSFSGAISMTDGHANTMSLIKDFDNNPKEGLYIAAKYCNELTAYGYSDWYLPSIVELDSLLRNYKTLHINGKRYWSSTEYKNDAAFAYCIDISNLPQEGEYERANKYNGFHCYFIRNGIK